MVHAKQKIITVLFILSFIIGGMTAGWFWHDMQAQLDAPINITAPNSLTYTIKPGMNLKQVGQDLTQQGILDHPYYFMLEGRLQGSESRLKAGEYLLKPGVTQRQLLEQFVAGKVVQHSLTLIEGWSFRQLMNEVSSNGTLVQTLANVDSETVMTALAYPEVHPEGRFFPDTYHFPIGMTDIEFLRRAYVKMARVLEEEWQQREAGLPYKTSDEALIMASILEKETAVAEERAAIAGVFVRRLQKGMKLQTDPTVIYAMGDDYHGNIRRKDLKIDSPYNTYFYVGLPPTPISLPGVEAIHAALHPEDGETLYFVAKGDGSHYFSKTLKEHNRAVARYQLGK
ncbi:MAG: endolytic transglycosylase MltG [Proteobacteria bacterium]|nr:endolytic transglycosylase MltG [Pseudomonadota bacterium]